MVAAEPLRDRLRPLHRGVARRLPPALRRHYLYAAAMRRWGNFEHPSTFNEKINWRILNDRRQRIVDACDKLRMKEIAARLVGPELLRIPRTLWSGTDVHDIDWAAVSGEWVLKPNHGSGDVILSPCDTDAIPGLTAGWLNNHQADVLGEWGYSRARELIVLEEQIPGPLPLIDYKVLVFDGRPRIIQVHRGRFGHGHTRSFYDPSWNLLPVRTTHQLNADIPRPKNLDKLLHVARELAAGWEFIRLDLYCVGDDIWLGEYSPYPCGGVAHFVPASFDQWLGTLWGLPTRRILATEDIVTPPTTTETAP